jgi:hypothetical protein
LTRAEAEAALEAVLADEPEWAGRIRPVELELEVAENKKQAFGSPSGPISAIGQKSGSSAQNASSRLQTQSI